MSREHLTLSEQETIISFDNETDDAKVYTHDARLIRKLCELSKKYPEQFVLLRTGPQKAVTYQIPKRCVGIRPPYSEDRRNRQIQDAKIRGLPFANENRKGEFEHE